MKKNQLIAMGMSAILACSGIAFAADQAPTVEETQDTADNAVQTPEVRATRLGSYATVKKIQKNETQISSILITTSEKQEIQLNVDSAATLVVDNESGLAKNLTDIKEGDTIYTYYSPVMTRSLPPQSACELILLNVKMGENTPASLHEVGSVTKTETGSEILTQAGDMMIRVDEKTKYQALKTKNMVTLDDMKEGTRFLAWYDIVLTSYPGQTYTEKIVILPENQETTQQPESVDVEQKPEESPTQAEKELTVVVDGKVLDVTAVMDGKNAVIPVRPVAEALGCTVSYAQKDGKEFVTVENETRTMTMQIGLDQYVSTTKIQDAVGMTTPTQYGVAPYITADKTYAPANLFEALVGFAVETKEDTLVITTQK